MTASAHGRGCWSLRRDVGRSVHDRSNHELGAVCRVPMRIPNASVCSSGSPAIWLQCRQSGSSLDPVWVEYSSRRLCCWAFNYCPHIAHFLGEDEAERDQTQTNESTATVSIHQPVTALGQCVFTHTTPWVFGHVHCARPSQQRAQVPLAPVWT